MRVCRYCGHRHFLHRLRCKYGNGCSVVACLRGED